MLISAALRLCSGPPALHTNNPRPPHRPDARLIRRAGTHKLWGSAPSCCSDLWASQFAYDAVQLHTGALMGECAGGEAGSGCYGLQLEPHCQRSEAGV
jgi:hypothetical protein